MDWDEYLRQAYISSDIEQIKTALEKGADPNVNINDDGDTILHWAASGRWTAVVRLLLKAGAKVAREDQADSTSVHAAVEENQKEILELLLAADGAVALNWFDYIDRTPLMWAAAEKNVELAQMLLRAGADVNARNAKGTDDTALKLAVEQNDSAMVDLLIRAGANPLLPGWMGLTAWHKAQELRSERGLKVRALIEKAVPPDERQETRARKRKK